MVEMTLRFFSQAETYTDIDIAPALLSLTRELQTNYYYQLETMDGKQHNRIRSQHEHFSIVLGNDKEVASGSIIATVAYLVAQANLNRTDIQLIYNGYNEGICYVDVSTMSASKLTADKTDYAWDMLNVDITLQKNGAIER